MKIALYLIVGSMILIGCSKGGGHSRLIEGGTQTQPADPTPTDRNFPEPGN